LYSFINVIGLAIGLASAIVIGSWVYQELSYDRHFERAGDIYRVGSNFFNVGAMAPGPEKFTPAARQFPEVELATSLSSMNAQQVHVGDVRYEERRVFAADSNFFDVFSYPFLKGNRHGALDHPNEVVITERLARKYFGREPALGKTLEIGEQKTPYLIVGVIEETPYKSHINADMWLSLKVMEGRNWTSARYYNYVMLREGFDEQDLRARINQLIRDVIYPSLQLNQPYEDWIKTSAAYQLMPIPITDIYLRSSLKFDLVSGGSETNVYVFAIVAVFILVIAAINFINIATARSAHRAKEVGIRKSLGGWKQALVIQFLMESVLTSFLALLLALGLSELFLSGFENLTGLQLLDRLFTGYEQILWVALLTLVIGVAAGWYPAIYLSSFNPVVVLKGQLQGSYKSTFRNALVVAQFTISIALLIGTGVVFQQLNHLAKKDLGLSAENVLVIENVAELGTQREVFKKELQQLVGVVSASYNKRLPAGSSVWVNTFRTPEMADGLPIQSFYGDYDFLATLGFHLVEGRNFSRDFASDSVAVILNQAAVEELMLANPVGTQLNGSEMVIGVVRDFNFENLRKTVQPVAIMLSTEGNRLAVKVKENQASAVVQQAQILWSRLNKSEPINYYFLDQRFGRLLEKEQIMARAVTLFAALAVIISCLGLFGLSAFVCEQRTKEVGVRKVLGASVSEIVVLLNKSFIKPVMIALGIASPIAYVVMNMWLANFAYKISIGPDIFLAAGVLALAIALLTVGYQAIRTAAKNPTESLRSE
jgi:putative ABC transport system permease protein